MAQGTWFAGADGRDDVQVAFLRAVRQQEAAFERAGCSAGDTAAFDGLEPLVLTVEVPRLSIPERVLEVALWSAATTTAPSSGPVLQGAWGEGYLLDAHNGNDFECLTVTGVDAPPEALAGWSVAWLLSQLARPVVVDEWLAGDRVVATRWSMKDTGRVLRRRGRRAGRLFGRAPDRSRSMR